MSRDEVLYDRNFFGAIEAGSRGSAKVIVPILLEATAAGSVVDYGCGDGSWLAEWVRHGVARVLGIDGPHVDPRTLKIPASSYLALDLRQPQAAPERFDLATCFEVAEHLPPSAAEGLVDALVASADAVAFGAAVPGQPGTGHINPRWQSYWAELFGRRGLVPVDVVRHRCWNDPSVEWWYSQNILLYQREGSSDVVPLDVAHPRLVEHLKATPGLREALSGLPSAARATASARLRRRRIRRRGRRR